ncbi:BREX-3 system phosphatase PglZ [Glaciimonas sp. GNP009]
MSLWIDRILNEFPSELARLWVAADPDGVLLDEQILSLLRERGFEVLPFEDSVTFRAEYEERYREAWDRNQQGPAGALVLHLRSAETGKLPWDYLRQARIVPLSLANLFSKLSYGVVRQIGAEHLETLFDAQSRHASQSLGEAATKEFVLTHIFRVSPHLMSRPEDLWRESLRLHYRDAGLPLILALHMAQILGEKDAFNGMPIAEMFSSKSILLRIVQDAWYRYLERIGVTGFRVSEAAPAEYVAKIEVPFNHPDVRAIVDSMFMDGTLHPLSVQGMPTGVPEWVKVGVVQDPAALQNLVLEGIKSLIDTLPLLTSSHRDWSLFARRFGEVLSRFHSLDTARADRIRDSVAELQRLADERLHAWVAKHYADLPSLPVAKGPVMVHHVPRFLSLRRSAGEDKIALLVFDGLAVDQWIQIREHVAKYSPKIGFEEGACFAWLPTLTSVSRQALFSGLKPREFAASIETTAQEPSQWSRFWQDHGLRPNEVMYRKGIKRVDQLVELETALSNPVIKVAGLVVDTVDEIVHGAILGKRGIANQIDSWCESGFVDRLFAQLLDMGYHVYLTADHGNVEAVGVGRPNQGVIAETRGERVRAYRSEALLSESAVACPGAIKLDIAGLPANFMPLFAGARTAFVTQGEQLVVHGGISVEELIVPFVKVSYVN